MIKRRYERRVKISYDGNHLEIYYIALVTLGRGPSQGLHENLGLYSGREEVELLLQQHENIFGEKDPLSFICFSIAIL